MRQDRFIRYKQAPEPFRDQDHHDAAKLPRIVLDEDLIVEYSMTAPEAVGGIDHEPDEALLTLRRQECTAWVFHAGRIVGGVVLKRYMVPDFIQNDEFVDLMDRDSAEEHELSIALDSQFREIGSDVGAYGDILELNRIWLAGLPALAGRSTEIVKALISAFCPGFALVILKAFPLEYEGRFSSTNEQGAYDAALQRRQRAMKRLYRREYGVRSMKGAVGDEGWMYRVRTGLEDIIE